MDTTVLEFLAAPFVASLILTGLHAYLGVHVVERGVIFVDLSLAQIAALGASIALLIPYFGGDPHGPGVYFLSLGFTFIGAAVFSSLPHGRKARIPPEAMIGISYAVASAASIVAKVLRDRVMRELDLEHPRYNWAQNKGYGTRDHLDALEALGPTVHHRMSFAPVAQAKLQFGG